MKKTILSKILLASLFVLSVSFVQAGIKKGSYAPKDVCCETYPSDTNAFLYPKDLGLACPNKFTLHADFIAMQAQEEGLEYAIENGQYEADNILNVGEMIGFSDSHNHSWGWDAGFKLGIGFKDTKYNFFMDAEWTWLQIHQKSSLNISGNSFLNPLWAPAIMVPTTSSKCNSADWQALYNTVDLKIAYPVHLSRFIAITPHAGLRFGYIEQDYIARYSYNYIRASGINIENFTVYNDNDYWGIGARGGLNSSLNFGGNFSLFAKFAASLLYGKFMIKQQSDIVADYDSQLKQDFYQILPNIDLGIGASFCKLLNDNKSLMTIKLGYEFHYWLHQNMMSRLRTQYTGTHGHYVLPERLKGDFSLGGIDLSVRFDF